MDSIGSAILDALGRVGEPEIYLLVSLAALSETTILADIFVPGEVAMALAGVIAATGPADVQWVILAAAVGAVVGDSTSYAIGRKWGQPLVCRLGALRKHLAPRLHSARHFFEEHGGAAVFFGRFIGVLRGLIPVAAGIAHMRLRRFLAWNVAASFAWAGTVITLGYLFGDPIATAIEEAGAWLLAAVAALLVVLLVRRLVHRVDHDAEEAAAASFCSFDISALHPHAVFASSDETA